MSSSWYYLLCVYHVVLLLPYFLQSQDTVYNSSWRTRPRTCWAFTTSSVFECFSFFKVSRAEAFSLIVSSRSWTSLDRSSRHSSVSCRTAASCSTCCSSSSSLEIWLSEHWCNCQPIITTQTFSSPGFDSRWCQSNPKKNFVSESLIFMEFQSLYSSISWSRSVVECFSSLPPYFLSMIILWFWFINWISIGYKISTLKFEPGSAAPRLA